MTRINKDKRYIKELDKIKMSNRKFNKLHNIYNNKNKYKKAVYSILFIFIQSNIISFC